MDDLISRRVAIDDIETVNPSLPLSVNWVKHWVKTLPSAQPELIERTSYIRGFEQGRTQGMIDSTIKAEWTNADALATNLQPTCKQLATEQPERKTGRWIDMNTSTLMYMPRYKCSICDGWANKSNFCPYCGAKMEVEHEPKR